MKTDSPEQWYVAIFAQDLRGKPIRRTILGIHLVFFRDEEGNAAALADRCPHRNAPLSEGRIVQGCLQCPYHGWKFNSLGECVEIPGLIHPISKEKKPSVEAFEILEQDRLIWIRLKKPEGSIDRLPLRMLGLDEIGNHAFFFQSSSSTQMLNALENLLDGTHTHFVHPGLIRREGGRKKVSARLKGGNEKIEIEYHGEGKQSGFISKVFGSDDIVGIGRFIFPCVGQLEYKNTKGRKLVLTAFFTPENENLLRVFVGVTYRKPSWLPGWLVNFILRPLFLKGKAQDAVILSKQADNLRSWGGKEQFHYTELDLIRPHIIRILEKNLDGDSEDQKSDLIFEREITLLL